MISGALEIIYGVDAGLVDPLNLPASQGPAMTGYIVIAYEDSPDVFDLLFVRGGKVEEYAGLHHNLRMLLSEKSVRMGLTASGMRCRVYLFSVSRLGFDRFLRTFHCVPSLNVVIDRLSRKQLGSLLSGAACTNGILEIDRPSHPFPLIMLSRFHSAEELLSEALRFRQGRMIVYDLELNTQIRQRVEIIIGDLPPGGGEAPEEPPEAALAERDARSPAPPPEGVPDEAPAGEDLAAVFRNTLKDFHQAVVELYGTRMNRKMSRIVSGVFPPPDPLEGGVINSLNAPLVLQVIEQCVTQAWRYRRGKLREKAQDIVRDLYNTYSDLLRQHDADAVVQECYRRLEA